MARRAENDAVVDQPLQTPPTPLNLVGRIKLSARPFATQQQTSDNILAEKPSLKDLQPTNRRIP
jgi:hypothetical protein